LVRFDERMRMTEKDRPFETRPQNIEDLVEKGGWQKPVAPPAASARPVGLPKVSQPQQSQPQGSGSGGGGQEKGDA
jgi:hypothetical protein